MIDPTKSKATIPGRTIITILWATQFVVALGAVLLVYSKRLSIPHCDSRCDFVLLTGVGDLFAWAALVLFVGVGVLLLARPSGKQWWLPAGGILLTIFGAFIASYFSDIALLM